MSQDEIYFQKILPERIQLSDDDDCGNYRYGHDMKYDGQVFDGLEDDEMREKEMMMKSRQRLLQEVESKRKIATIKRKREEEKAHHCCYHRYFHQMHLMFLTEVRERKARLDDELVANASNILEVLCSKNHFGDCDQNCALYFDFQIHRLFRFQNLTEMING